MRCARSIRIRRRIRIRKRRIGTYDGEEVPGGGVLQEDVGEVLSLNGVVETDDVGVPEPEVNTHLPLNIPKVAHVGLRDDLDSDDIPGI